MIIDNLPFDKYELEPSPLTLFILARKQPKACWQVYIQARYYKDLHYNNIINIIYSINILLYIYCLHPGQQQGRVCAPVRLPQGLYEPPLGQPLCPPLQLPHAAPPARRPLQGEICKDAIQATLPGHTWSHLVTPGHTYLSKLSPSIIRCIG